MAPRLAAWGWEPSRARHADHCREADGGLARRPSEHHRPRRVVVEGTPEQLKSERDGDTVVVELESPGDAAGAAMRPVGMRGGQRGQRRHSDPAGQGRERITRCTDGPRGSGRGRPHSRLGDGRAPDARRRVPPSRGPPIRGDSMSNHDDDLSYDDDRNPSLRLARTASGALARAHAIARGCGRAGGWAQMIAVTRRNHRFLWSTCESSHPALWRRSH